LYRDLDDRFGQANALNDLGSAHYLSGDYPAATASHKRALALSRDLNNRHGEAEALNNPARALCTSGAAAASCAHYVHARSILQAVGAPLEEARALEGIGNCHLLQGQVSEGRAHLQTSACTIPGPRIHRHPARRNNFAHPGFTRVWTNIGPTNIGW